MRLRAGAFMLPGDVQKKIRVIESASTRAGWTQEINTAFDALKEIEKMLENCEKANEAMAGSKLQKAAEITPEPKGRKFRNRK